MPRLGFEVFFKSIYIAFMIDISLIKDRYSKMTDEQLVFLAKSDALSITHEAFIAFKREFKSRNLQPEIIHKIEEQRIALKKQKIIHSLERESQSFNHKIWSRLFELIQDEEPDEVIIQTLVDEGVRLESAVYIIENLEMVVRNVLEKTKKHINKCILSFGGGCLVLVFNYYFSITDSLYFYGFLLALAGAIKWADNDKEKTRFEKILHFQQKKQLGSD